MNKKIIAIAVASVMAAPVAMADIKISGRLGGHLTTVKTDGSQEVREFGDAGQTRLQFDGTAGNGFARIAFDERNSRDQKLYSEVKRDAYAGYKFGGGMSAQFGRMGGVAKNLEKDPYIGTFLETRGGYAEARTSGAYGNSSFVNHVIQFNMKAGAANVAIQFDPASTSSTQSPNPGHTAIGVNGKAGGVGWYASYNNGTANLGGTSTSQSNMKVGASMKFGKVKASLNYSNADDATNKWNSINVRGDMGLGNGLSVNAGFASTGGDAVKSGTWMRVAVNKVLSKGTNVYAGYTNSTKKTGSVKTNTLGLGLTVKF